jgi:hypothetical protein
VARLCLRPVVHFVHQLNQLDCVPHAPHRKETGSPPCSPYRSVGGIVTSIPILETVRTPLWILLPGVVLCPCPALLKRSILQPLFGRTAAGATFVAARRRLSRPTVIDPVHRCGGLVHH